MAFQFIVGFATASAVSISLIHLVRDRYDLKNLVDEKKLDKKVVEIKYKNVSHFCKVHLKLYIVMLCCLLHKNI